ncbi:hypothetical protein P775_13620 [Puniceibacterium antarcticum]|uniref:Uncharacterized protein n=1 Tax=Puniceibacterium antarcticum TaxID=1206336 RepID=A0A2G8RDD3_9RHOB|nr:hypothetical protein [Puniceibacterium antarcticum]PIL19557.1 hypothetical protein P775_13620 [Puniceibacterium antarcticum]
MRGTLTGIVEETPEFNNRRLLGPIGKIPQAEAEENFDAQRDVLEMLA